MKKNILLFLFICLFWTSSCFAYRTIQVKTNNINTNVDVSGLSEIQKSSVYLNHRDSSRSSYYANIQPWIDNRCKNNGSSNNIYRISDNSDETYVNISQESNSNILYYKNGSTYNSLNQGNHSAFAIVSDIYVCKHGNYGDRYRTITPVNKLRTYEPNSLDNNKLLFNFRERPNSSAIVFWPAGHRDDYTVYNRNNYTTGIWWGAIHASSITKRHGNWKNTKPKNIKVGYEFHRCGDGHPDNGSFANFDNNIEQNIYISEQCDDGPNGSPTCGAPGTANACQTITTTDGVCNTTITNNDIYDFNNNGDGGYITTAGVGGIPLCTSGTPINFQYLNNRRTRNCQSNNGGSNSPLCAIDELYCGNQNTENSNSYFGEDANEECDGPVGVPEGWSCVACELVENLVPNCIFDGPICGIDPEIDNTFTATGLIVEGVNAGDNICLMLENDNGNDRNLGTTPYTEGTNHNITFNLDNYFSFQGGTPPVPNNGLRFYRAYNCSNQNPTPININGNNCSDDVPVIPSCEINNQTGIIGEDMDLYCTGLYGIDAELYLNPAPNGWSFNPILQNEDPDISSINLYNYHFTRNVVGNALTYNMICEIEPVELMGDTCGPYICEATLTIEEHTCDNDGEIEDGEECDDGNTDSGDGCSFNCELEIPRCSGGVGRSPWNIDANFFTSLLNNYSPFNAYFTVDGRYPGGTTNDNIRASMYFFSGSVSDSLTRNFFSPLEQLIYNTGHVYTDTGTINYGFRLQNTVTGATQAHSVRCTGEIEILDQPDVHITKVQRNDTRDLPDNIGTYTGNIVNYRSGDIVYYQLIVGNSGANPTNSTINIADHFGPGINLTNRWSGLDCATNVSTLNGTIAGGWTITDLVGTSVCTINLSGTIDNDDYSQGELNGICQNPRVNTGILAYNGIFSTGTVYGDYLPFSAYDLLVTKVFNPRTGTVGGQINFTIIITNNGLRNLYGLEFNDNLPSSLSGNGSFGANLNRPVGTLLAGGGTTSRTWTVDIANDVNLSGTYIYNTGVVTDICLGTFTGSDSFWVINESAEITIEKLQRNRTYCQNVQNGSVVGDSNVACAFTGDDVLVYDQGDVLEYQIIVENTSNVGSDISIEDTTSFGLQITAQSFQGFNPLTFNGTIPGNNLTRDGHIDANTSGTIYLTGLITNWLPNYFRNAVHIDYEGGDDDDEVYARKVSVSVDKMQKNVSLRGTDGLWQDGDINFMNGDEIWYRLVYGNYTSGVITNVTVQDTFETGFIYGGEYSTPDLGAPTQNGNTITRTVGDLQPNQTGEIIITGLLFSDNGYPVYTNTGIIIYDGGSGYDEVDAIPYGNLLFDKSQRNGTTNPGGNFSSNVINVASGDIVEYRLYFENPTLETVNMNIIDVFPDGFEPTNRNVTPGTNGTFPTPRPAGNTTPDYRYWSWDVTLPVGGTGLIYISGYISNTDDYQVFVNTGDILCMTAGGEYCGSSEDHVVAIAAQFEFHKYVSPNPVANGEDVTFRLCYENNGFEAMTNYTIIDYLPITMEYLGNVRYEASGGILSGDITIAPTVTQTASGYTTYEWFCGQAGGQLNGINGLCPIPAGTGGNACLLFDARPRY